jgi:flagellar biosynthetic protein FliR
MIERLVLAHAVTFALIASRMAGFVVVSPFPGERIPVTSRIGFVVVMAWIATAAIVVEGAPPPVDLGLVFDAIMEVAIGAAIGFAFRLAHAGAEILGSTLGQALGLGTPAILNPAAGAQDSALGHLMTAFAMLIILGAGVHRMVLGYLLESVRAIPPGSPIAFTASAPLFLDLSSRTISMGIQLALPALALSLAVQLALALLARAAPAMQIFNVGFSVMVASGLAALAANVAGLTTGLLAWFAQLPPFLDRLLLTFAGR